MPARFRQGARRHKHVKTTYSSQGKQLSATTTTSTSTTPGFGVTAPSAPSIAVPSPSGKGGLVAFLAATLFLFATWDQLGSKVWAVIWGSDTSPTTVYNVNWRLVFAGILFIVAMATLASINADMGNIMALSVLAMWLVWIIQPGTPANQKSPISGFFDWFTTPQKTQNIVGGIGSGTFGNQPNQQAIPGYPNNQYSYQKSTTAVTPTNTVNL
jgi:hypothetical protein